MVIGWVVDRRGDVVMIDEGAEEYGPVLGLGRSAEATNLEKLVW